MPAGRPTKYNDELLEKARDYLVHYEDYDDVVPSIAGLSVVLKISRDTVHTWAKEEDKEEFSDIVAQLMGKQEKTLLSGGLRGDYNPTIAKLLLTKHNYSERTQTEHSGPGGGPMEFMEAIKPTLGPPDERDDEDY